MKPTVTNTKHVAQTIIKSYLAVWKDEPALEKLNEIAETCIESVIYPLDGSYTKSLSVDERMIADDLALHIDVAIEELRNPPPSYQGDGFEPINDTIVVTS